MRHFEKKSSRIRILDNNASLFIERVLLQCQVNTKLEEIVAMSDFYKFLAEYQVTHIRHDHPPLYTVDDVKRLVPDLPGEKTKNLFLRDKPGKRHFLVVVKAEKQVDLKGLQEFIGCAKLSFGSAERLKKYLGITPGAVSIFAIYNDRKQAVEVYVDQELWSSDAFQFHPLVNTSTLTISKKALLRFIDAVGHPVQIIDVPEKR